MAELEIQNALQAFQRGELSGARLTRMLLQHPTWFVPATLESSGPSIQFIRPPGQGVWLEVFSSSELMAQSPYDTKLVLQLSGTGVVGLLDDSLAGINFDPYANHTIHFKNAQFNILQHWIQCFDVESVLHGREVAQGFAALRNYPGFYTILRRESLGDSLVLTPDMHGRRLAAVFTARDCLESFYQRLRTQQSMSDYEVVEESGISLFRKLAHQPLDGIVFNPLGPEPPKAVAIAFAQVVLTAVDPEVGDTKRPRETNSPQEKAEERQHFVSLLLQRKEQLVQEEQRERQRLLSVLEARQRQQEEQESAASTSSLREPTGNLTSLVLCIGESSYTLSEGQSISIGRDPELVTLLAEHGTISRRHAELSLQHGRLMLRDFGSSNGAWKNQQRLGTEAVVVERGDEVLIGQQPLEIQWPREIAKTMMLGSPFAAQSSSATLMFGPPPSVLQTAKPTPEPTKPQEFSYSRQGGNGNGTLRIALATETYQGGSMIEGYVEFTALEFKTIKSIYVELIEYQKRGLSKGNSRDRVFVLQTPRKLTKGEVVSQPVQLLVPKMAAPSGPEVSWEVHGYVDIDWGFDIELKQPVSIR